MPPSRHLLIGTTCVHLCCCHFQIGCCHGSITVEEAKEVHRSLKLAAGMFLHIKEQLLPKLPATPEKGTDFDVRVVDAYVGQSQAEAQEGICIYLLTLHAALQCCVCSDLGASIGAWP